MAIVGVDIGATKLLIRVEAEGDAWTRRVELPDGSDLETDARLLVDGIGEALRGSSIEAAGVAAAPTLGANGQVVRWPNRPWWQGFDLAAALGDALGVAPSIEDDGNAAALAESAALSTVDLLFLCIGTGVGGGLVLGGRLYRGRSGRAAELGHVVLDPHGAACACGRRGCLQAIASGPAMLARAARRRGALVTPSDLDAALLQGSEWAVSTVRESVDALGRTAMNVCELLDLERVVLGGSVAIHTRGYLEGIRQAVVRWSRPGQELPSIEASVHGANASLAGALHLARSRRAMEAEENR